MQKKKNEREIGWESEELQEERKGEELGYL